MTKGTQEGPAPVPAAGCAPPGGLLPSVPHAPSPEPSFRSSLQAHLLLCTQPRGPHLGRQQVVELGGEIELDALPGPREGHSADQQHEQDEVGECGREIHHLRSDQWAAGGGGAALHPTSS